MLCDNREGLFCDIPPSGFIIVGKPFPIRALLLVFQEGIIHILGDSLGMIALIIFSHCLCYWLVVKNMKNATAAGSVMIKAG